MIRPISRHYALAALAVGSLAFAACSSDNTSKGGSNTLPGGVTLPDGITIPADITIPDEITLPDGVTLPPGVTLPNVSGACAQAAVALGQMLSAAVNPAASQVDLDEALNTMQAGLPDELKADGEILAGAYKTYGEILAKYGGDINKAMTDPEAQQALQEMGTPEIQAASNRVQAYFDSNCQTT